MYFLVTIEEPLHAHKTMGFITLSKAEFLYICKIMNGVECKLFTFRANVLCGMLWHNTDLDQKVLSRKLQVLSDFEINALYTKVQEYWNTDMPFITDNRLAELGLYTNA